MKKVSIYIQVPPNFVSFRIQPKWIFHRPGPSWDSLVFLWFLIPRIIVFCLLAFDTFPRSIPRAWTIHCNACDEHSASHTSAFVPHLKRSYAHRGTTTRTCLRQTFTQILSAQTRERDSFLHLEVSLLACRIFTHKHTFSCQLPYKHALLSL